MRSTRAHFSKSLVKWHNFMCLMPICSNLVYGQTDRRTDRRTVGHTLLVKMRERILRKSLYVCVCVCVRVSVCVCVAIEICQRVKVVISISMLPMIKEKTLPFCQPVLCPFIFTTPPPPEFNHTFAISHFSSFFLLKERQVLIFNDLMRFAS